jgi:hypothetical protein
MNKKEGLTPGSEGNAGAEIEALESNGGTSDPKNGTAAAPLKTPDFFADKNKQTGADVGEQKEETEPAAPAAKADDDPFADIDTLFDPAKQDSVLDRLLTDPEKTAANAKAAVKSATQKNMQLSQERQTFEAEKSQTLNELKEMRQQMQQQMQQMQQMVQLIAAPQPSGSAYGADYEPSAFDDEITPAARKAMQSMKQELAQTRNELALMNMDMSMRSIDQNLKGQFPDYDPKRVDDVVRNLNHAQIRELVYKASKFDTLDVPAMLAEAERRGAEKALANLRKIYQSNKEIRDPITLGGSAGGDKKLGTPKTFEEARQRASGVQLFS